MANATTISNFIKEIAPCAQYAYKTLGKVKPSICIGMACVESAYGTSQVMRNHHAFMGHKVGSGKTATRFWEGTFFKSKTKEEYTIGTHTVITDAFRSYSSTQQCILNFYELLNTKLYNRVKADADYRTQMQQIKQCGYMTSSTEVNSVINLIQKYNLTQYDDIVEVKPDTPSKPTNPYKRTIDLIKRGMKGESVKWLQFALNQFGYNLKVDGDFGTKTYTSVIDFQQKHSYQGKKLKVDGLVGLKTIWALENG